MGKGTTEDLKQKVEDVAKAAEQTQLAKFKAMAKAYLPQLIALAVSLLVIGFAAGRIARKIP